MVLAYAFGNWLILAFVFLHKQLGFVELVIIQTENSIGSGWGAGVQVTSGNEPFDGVAGVVDRAMNHLIQQSPIRDALQIVDALRIAKEIREDLSRQLFSVFLFQQSHLLDLVAEKDISKRWAKRNQREINAIGRSCIWRGGSYLPQWL